MELHASLVCGSVVNYTTDSFELTLELFLFLELLKDTLDFSFLCFVIVELTFVLYELCKEILSTIINVDDLVVLDEGKTIGCLGSGQDFIV